MSGFNAVLLWASRQRIHTIEPDRELYVLQWLIQQVAGRQIEKEKKYFSALILNVINSTVGESRLAQRVKRKQKKFGLVVRKIDAIMLQLF